MRRAKIVCTIGPSSQDVDTIRAMIRAGMNVARLNFSHGDHRSHQSLISLVRRAADAECAHVAILQDLPGPKIRIGAMEPDTKLITGTQLRIITGDERGNEQRLFTQYEHLPRDVKPGETILLNDGSIVLRAQKSTGDSVHCLVVDGGPLPSRKGINLPQSQISAPSFTAEDRRHLGFGVEQGVDIVALSFVRGPEEIMEARKAAAAFGAPNLPLLAKIEKPQAIENLDDIIEAADGIMVARGDLGVEMEPQTVPILQKRMIEKANACGKAVITATQMLESMTVNRRPTRAEASDVANAVFDGTDALMLSGETAGGAHPIESVAMMHSIILEAERYLDRRGAPPPTFIKDEHAFANAVAKSATMAARELKLDAIVVLTRSGFTARLLSDYRPPVPIIGVSPSAPVCRRMALDWGVSPVMFREVRDVEAALPELESFLIKADMLGPGDRFALTSGSAMTGDGSTNLLHLKKTRS